MVCTQIFLFIKMGQSYFSKQFFELYHTVHGFLQGRPGHAWTHTDPLDQHSEYARHSCQECSQSGNKSEVPPGADLSSLVERRDQSEVTLRRWSYIHPQPCHMGHLSMQVGIIPMEPHFQDECSWQEIWNSWKAGGTAVSSWSHRKYEWIFMQKCFHRLTRPKTLLWLCCSPCWEKWVAISTAFQTTVSYVCVILWTCN